MSFFLSLSLPLFFRLIPWTIEALCIHFPAWASKTRSRRHSASSFWLEGALRLHSGERVPVASVNRASPLSGALLPFCVKQGISASILSSLIHSFIHSPMPFILRVPWILQGLDLSRRGTSFMVLWLRLCAPNAGCLGLIPGPGTTPHML